MSRYVPLRKKDVFLEVAEKICAIVPAKEIYNMERLSQEEKVRELVGTQLGVHLAKRRLVLGTRIDGTRVYHEFDAVSPDGEVVVEVKTNELKPTSSRPRGRFDSAQKQALCLDVYLLSRVSAKTKMLVLTDRPLFDMFVKEMEGILPSDVSIHYCAVN